MDEDHLLNDIGRLAREEDAGQRRRFDERWRRLAEGTISEADDAALRALAEGSEEARLDYEALRPLGPEFHARMARAWRARTPGPEPAVLGSRRRRAGPYRWLALAAALAVAVVGWRLVRGPGEALPALPEYGYEITGEVRELRSPEAPSGVPVFVPGSPFRLLLRPRQPIEGDLERRYYLESSDGELRPWRVDLAMSADGVVEIAGAVGQDLSIDPGDWTFVFLYGRSGRLPAPEELGTAGPADDWAVVRVPFRVEAGPVSSIDPGLAVEFAGCQAYFADRTCIPGGELTLWVPAATRLELRVGDRRLDDPGVAVDGGRRFTFAASPADGEVEVRAETVGGEETWRFELAGRELPDWLLEAQRLFTTGELAAARDLLEGRVEGAAPVAAALARGVLARVLLRLGRPEEEVLALLEEAIEAHRRSGDLANLARDTGMALYLDFRRQRFPSALERLDELSLVLPPDAPFEARFTLVYNRGVLERKLGNLRAALELVGREIALTRRMGLAQKQRVAEEAMALVLQDLGRFDEANDLLRGLESAYEHDPCGRMRVLDNRAWGLIRAADPGLGDPLPLLAAALEIAGREGCGGSRTLDARLNEALALVESGKTWEGLRALEEARALADAATPLQRLWWEQIEGLLALRDGRALDALERFEHLEELSLGSLFPEGQWLAKLGQARARVLLDDTPAALAALDRADALLDEQSLRVPLHAGRGLFMARREEGARLHLELLLTAGHVTAALDVARRSRARLLRGLRQSHRLAHLTAAERTVWNREIATYLQLRDAVEAEAADDWRLSAAGLEQAREGRAERRNEALRALDRAFLVLGRDRPVEPPPLRPGEAVLVYHPLPRGWVGFAAAPGKVEFHRFELPDDVLSRPEELARRLLEPFRDTLAAAGQVRVLPYGRLNEIDFHALPWAGDVFMAEHLVVYGLDLAVRPAVRSPRRALVVADPRGDLPAAHEEGEAVTAALTSPPTAWDVVRLEGDAATAVRVRDLAAGVELLHYAGHGVFAGQFGWESALLLAGEGRLTLGDVLTLGRAPAKVVLSSCESARADRDGVAASLGLAQAFLVAGSERVVAATRPVGDRATAGFFRELYRDGSWSADLAGAFRRAQLAWRERDPAADWESFRLLEP